MKNYYYISTGELNGFYTLRHCFNETVYFRSEGYESTGAVEASVVERDWHIRNLSTDRDEAIEKANTWADEHSVPANRRRFNADFSLEEIKRRSAEQIEAANEREAERIRTTDWNILPFGKHAGEDLRNLINTDPSYVKFVAGWDSGDGKYCAAIAKQLVAPIVAEEEKQRESKKSRLVSIFGEDRLKSYAENAYSSFSSSIARSIIAGQEVSERGLSIFCEIIAKESGRSNSKAFKAEFSRLCDLVFCEA